MSTSPEPRDVALEAVAKAMSRLETVLSRSTPEATHEQIPRSMLLEIDHWDPDELEVVPIGTFLEIFDGITGDLTETQKSREDPEKAAERLWTMQKSTGETFRQYAERVRHTAAQAAKVDGLLMDDVQRRMWIEARSVKAFLRGLPGQYAGFFVNNPPASLEEALKKAEQLEDALEPREADHWNVTRIQTQDKRCFRCRELGHIASGCPNIPRPPTPPPQRRNAIGSPQKPCLYCGGRTHFPAHCLKNPKNFPCEYCGLYGHKESDCRVKLNHYADESMCDYCGYYGHLEAECPQKTETCIKMGANHRPEPRKVLALTSEAYEPNPQQAVSLRAEKKTADAPSTPTSRMEEPDICVPAHPKTGQSVVISEVITGYLAPARPVPMPDVAQPMRPRVAVVGSSDAFDPSQLLESADVDVLASDDCPILDPSEELPTEDLDEPIPDLLEVLEQQLQHLPKEDIDYVTNIMTKYQHLFQRPDAQGCSMNVKESGVLESGVNMMCHATNAEDRQHGWHRYTSALKFLKKYTMGRQPDATPALDVDSLATALAQKLRLPPVSIPTPREIAREVLDTVKPLIPPANPNLAVQIAELVRPSGPGETMHRLQQKQSSQLTFMVRSLQDVSATFSKGYGGRTPIHL
ncbi:hypothetical protein GE061_009044 [Apolygus lucorum]|uniref:CCHC-type domain-containing protein n=1 Tax=Apolygus lucorum TaxID=248454 RepID=A0A8S9Y0D7_APOLU|nr:hypothetical protein GE061_009044 [Apolygus lucorum]